MSERRPFEFTIGGRDIVARVGECACYLFRTMGEVDYLAVNLEDDQILRVFNNPDDVRWMAGYQLVNQGENLYRSATRKQFDEGVQASFREMFGWNPMVIEREEPNEEEIEMWVDLNTTDLDGGLDG